MTRSSALILLLVSVLYAHAQRARMDSLQAALNRQPTENLVRAYTLAALAKTCSTIDPKRAFVLSRQAVALAQKLKSDEALADAWVSQRWAYYYLGEYGVCDSVNQLAAAATKRSGDPRSWALTYGAPHYISSMADTTARKRFERSLHIADSLGDRALAAEILYWNGIQRYAGGTAAMLEQAIAFYRSVGDSSGVAMCLFTLEDFEPYASDRELKQRNVERATALFDQDGNIIWSLWAHGRLCMTATEQADYKTAVQEGLTMQDKAIQVGLDSEIWYAQDALAKAYRSMGDLRAALNCHLRALKHTIEMDDRLSVLNQLGRTYWLMGDPDSAAHYLEEAMREHQDWMQKHPLYKEWRYHEAEGYLAEIRAAAGRIVEAAVLFRSALGAHQGRTSAYVEEVWASLGLAHLLANATEEQLKAIGTTKTEARVEARGLLLSALELAKELRMLKEQQDALHGLALLYEQIGDVNKAFAYQKAYAVMKDSVLNADKAKAVAALQIQYDTEKKEQQIILLGKDKEVQAKEIQKQKLVRNGFVGGFLVVLLFAGVFFAQRRRIKKEHGRSEELLLNILPQEVAEELKAKGEADAKQIDKVTVLFTDFKGFTAMSEQLTPKELVHDLHECFSAFDHIMARHGIEKIKTIGDAYMAAGGLPTPNTTHALDVVKAALEIRDFIAEGKARKVAAGLPYFEIRIGIHTGPVVAGIVGVKKFAYDIWGDTVNTASRMESSGEVGQVNISESTYALVKDASTPLGMTEFVFTPRGKVQAKGKGEMEMYFVRSESA